METLILNSNSKKDVRLLVDIAKKLGMDLKVADEQKKKVSPKQVKTMKDFWGALSDETAKKLHQHVAQSRNEWELIFISRMQ
ncbi:hypothetical protein [Parapedobacter tibetensis]|uniref:hypothetical protein n=1 Tax=Parapedobacter tibetensis TaxID=2972951 RepID=UPI00214DD8C6|nr:hypothetical protein [Parapedobacter tibetensis]